MEVAVVERRPDYGMQIEILVSLLYNFFVQSGDAVVDGGVAGALHTIPLSRLVAPGGVVYGFEASPPVAAWLKTELAALPTATNIEFFPFALGDAQREVEFIIEKDSGYSHVRRAGEELPEADSGRRVVPVTMVTLDETLPADAAIRFIKLDLEGMDFAALCGGRNLLRRHRPLIVFENAQNVTADEFCGFFRDIDYEVFDLEGVPITPANLGRGNLSFEVICAPSGDPRLDKVRTLIDGFWAALQNRPVMQSWAEVGAACRDVFGYLLRPHAPKPSSPEPRPAAISARTTLQSTAIPSRKPRLVCLVYPLNATMPELLSHAGTIAIIASEQILLMQLHITEYEVCLYNDALEPRGDDVLLVVTCLPLAPNEILRRFHKVVYFFDDLNTWRYMNDTAYRSKVVLVDVIFHPVRTVAEDLARKVGKPTFYLPWSIARLPSPRPKKSDTPSFFVDMDDRDDVSKSITSGIEFIGLIQPLSPKVFVPEKYAAEFPVDLRRTVTFVPRLQHLEFLRLLGQAWFYASGIEGSYEYSVLESAFMGCGLISIRSAIRDEHRRRSVYMDYTGGGDGRAQVKALIEDFDPATILSDAVALYPAVACKQVPKLLEQVFP